MSETNKDIFRTYEVSLNDTNYKTDLLSTLSSYKPLLLDYITVPSKFYIVLQTIWYQDENEIIISFQHKTLIVDSEVKKAFILNNALVEIQANFKQFFYNQSVWILKKLNSLTLYLNE